MVPFRWLTALEIFAQQGEAAQEGPVSSDWWPGVFLVFIVVTGYAVVRRRRRTTRGADPREPTPRDSEASGS